MTAKIGGFAIDACSNCRFLAVTLGWHHPNGLSYCRACMSRLPWWKRMGPLHQREILMRWTAIEKRADVHEMLRQMRAEQERAA